MGLRESFVPIKCDGSLPAVLPSIHGTKSLDGSLHHHANVKAYLQQTMQQFADPVPSIVSQ